MQLRGEHERFGTTDEERTRSFLRLLHDRRGSQCRDCGQVLCGHEFTMSVVLGFLDAPRCWECLARDLDRQPEELRDHVYDYIRWRACFFSGWRLSSEHEGFGDATQPRCLWPEDRPARPVPRPGAVPPVPDATVLPSSVRPKEDAVWEAGDMSCGDLVLELRRRLTALGPGQVLRVVALDPAAPEDLPAWCRLTGHTLAAQAHPDYWIRRKEG